MEGHEGSAPTGGLLNLRGQFLHRFCREPLLFLTFSEIDSSKFLRVRHILHISSLGGICVVMLAIV